MTTKLQLLDDFLNPILIVPVGQKSYRFKMMSASSALLLQAASDQTEKAIAEGKDPHSVELEVGSEETAEEMERRVFGDTYDELVNDDLPPIVMFRLSQIIMAWTFYGVESAQAFVDNGGKAPTKKPQDRQPKTATRTRTAAASTTRKRNSATTTSSPKATTEKATSGPKSSPTGTPSNPTSRTSE